MTSARVDMKGQLVEMLALPGEQQGPGAEENVTDAELMVMAGLEPSAYEPIHDSEPVSSWKPPCYASEYTVYSDQDSKDPAGAVIARDDGRCVYFFAGPLLDENDRWFVPDTERLRTPGDHRVTLLDEQARSPVVAMLHILMLLIGIPLAFHNLALSRTDRKGAVRYAVLVGSLHLLIWLFGVHHTANFVRESRYLRDFIHVWSGYVFRIWIYYLALEPYVRRYWPRMLISWTRALNGRFLDPLLGRDILWGCIAGTTTGLLVEVTDIVVGMITENSNVPARLDPNSLIWVGANILSITQYAISLGLVYLMLLFVFRAFSRSSTFAVLALAAIFMSGPFWTGDFRTLFLVSIMVITWGVIFTRFGLVAGITTIFITRIILSIPLVPQLTMWYGHATFVVVITVWAVAGFGHLCSTVLPNRSRISPA